MVLTVSVASSREAREDVYRLRYDAYHFEGAISSLSDARFTDDYDLLPTSILICVSDADRKAVGSLRFSIQPPSKEGLYEPLSCPEFLVFPEVLAKYSCDNRPIASGSRFSIEPNHEKRMRIALLLLLAEAKAAKAARAKWGMATARGSHIRMYNRFFLKEACEPRRMPGLNYDYALLISNIDDDFENSMDAFPNEMLEKFDESNSNWSEEIRSRLSLIDGSEKWL